MSESKENPSSSINFEALLEVEVASLDDPSKGKQKIRSLVSGHSDGCVLLLVRRPGCWLCRGDARNLSLTRDKLKAAGVNVKLIAVFKEVVGKEIEDFRPYFPAGDLYLDAEKQSYKAIGFNKVSLGQLFSKASISHYNESVKNGVKGNLMTGEGSIKGGAFVFDSAGSPVFEYLEQLGQFPIDQIHDKLAEINKGKLKVVEPNAAPVDSNIPEIPAACTKDACKL